MKTAEKKQYASGVEWEYFGYDYQLVHDSLKKNYPLTWNMVRVSMEAGFDTYQPIFSDTVMEPSINLSDDIFEIRIGKKIIDGKKRYLVYYQRKNKSVIA